MHVQCMMSMPNNLSRSHIVPVVVIFTSMLAVDSQMSKVGCRGSNCQRDRKLLRGKILKIDILLPSKHEKIESVKIFHGIKITEKKV